jgi:hypothetical protein
LDDTEFPQAPTKSDLGSGPFMDMLIRSMCVNSTAFLQERPVESLDDKKPAPAVRVINHERAR